MKTIHFLTLTLLGIFALSSCGSGATAVADNEFLKQLPDDQKSAYLKNIENTCNCAKTAKGGEAVTAAANDFAAYVDDFVAAVEAKDYQKASTLDEDFYNKMGAMQKATKEFQEKNPQTKECLDKFREGMTAQESELLDKANGKLGELVDAKFKDDISKSMQTQAEIMFSICPDLEKMDPARKIRIAAMEKQAMVMDKYREMVTAHEDASIKEPAMVNADTVTTVDGNE